MKLERITLYKLTLPLALPLETSFGRVHELHPILVHVQGEGVEGWGECPTDAFPGYSYETWHTAWHVLHDFLIPPLLGRSIARLEDLQAVFGPVRGHPFAKTGLEWAILDALARSEGISLAQKLGGVRTRVPVGVSLGIEPTLPVLIAHVDRFVAAGYRRIKLKIKPGWDVAVAQAVRARYPNLLLMLDANSAYSLDHLPLFQALDELDLLMIEQPLGCDDIYFHSLLQAQVRTPICLDESIHSPDHARAALALGACKTINIKPGRMGGPSAGVQVHDLCQAAGMPVWHGGMLETGIGRAANLAMASLPNFTLPGDISASSRYWQEDIVDPPAALNPDSTITVPTGPGLGVTVRMDVIKRFVVRRET